MIQGSWMLQMRSWRTWRWRYALVRGVDKRRRSLMRLHESLLQLNHCSLMVLQGEDWMSMLLNA